MRPGFLGEIDQHEVDAEGANHLFQGLHVEVVDELHQAPASGLVVLLAQTDVALAQFLHRIVDRLSRVVAQQVAQQCPQQLHA